jgi:hypothetical protein
MKASTLNPFGDLYFSESAPEKEFVAVFSDKLIAGAGKLFQRGNVILRGTQGSGKTMLLSLLRPEVRIAFSQSDRLYPIPPQSSEFLGCGISLLLDRAFDIGQVDLSTEGEDFKRVHAQYFADYVNYLILRDLTKSVNTMLGCPAAWGLPAVLPEKLESFTRSLAKEDCFADYLKDCDSFESLRSRINSRIREYRQVQLGNADSLSIEVSKSKTEIGEPIARAVKALQKAEILPSQYSLFVRIDEFDLLHWINALSSDVQSAYYGVFDDLLSRRDRDVSYKVGTRPYGWRGDSVVGRPAKAPERERSYKIVDIERDLLRPRENTLKNIFRRFADDVLERRLKHFGIQCEPGNGLKLFLGATPSPEEKVMNYTANSSPEMFLDFKAVKTWHPGWLLFLQRFGSGSGEDRLDAKLAQAWALQKGGNSKGVDRTSQPPLWTLVHGEDPTGEKSASAKPYIKSLQTADSVLFGQEIKKSLALPLEVYLFS